MRHFGHSDPPSGYRTFIGHMGHAEPGAPRKQDTKQNINRSLNTEPTGSAVSSSPIFWPMTSHAEDPEHVKETACIEAITTLKLAQSRIVSCGYFTASSSLIEQIELTASRMRSERGRQLCQMCRETLRDFSREAADFRRAARFNNRLERGLLPPAVGKPAGATLSSVELRHLERQYYDGVILTGLRSYERAEAEFRALFRQLGFPHTWRESCHWSDMPGLDIRQMGRDWARSQKGNPDILKLAIRTCRRYMFLEMLIRVI